MAGFQLPTFAEVTLALAVQGKTWRGGYAERDGRDGYQADAMRVACRSSKFIRQAPRQVGGKTDEETSHAQAVILKGGTAIIGLPTQIQAGSVLRKRIVEGEDGESGLLKWEQAYGRKFRRKRSDVHLTQWSNGGTLMLVGARTPNAVDSQRPRANQTGRTGNVLYLDEAQGMFDEDVRELFPFVNIAMINGNGMIYICGVGGPSASIIEAKKLQGYAVAWHDDERVIRDWPEAQARLDEEREEQTTEFYDSNYRCLPVAMGARMLYVDLPPLETPPPYAARTFVDQFGIDVGRTRDYTCLAHKRFWPMWGRDGITHLLALKQIPHGKTPDQADWAAGWIRERSGCQVDANGDTVPGTGGQMAGNGVDVAVETNGVGYGFHDDLSLLPGFAKVRKVNMDDRKKHRAIQAIRVKLRNGTYQVSPQVRTARLGHPPRRLDELGFKINEKGVYEYDHHDGNMALVVAELAAADVESA